METLSIIAIVVGVALLLRRISNQRERKRESHLRYVADNRHLVDKKTTLRHPMGSRRAARAAADYHNNAEIERIQNLELDQKLLSDVVGALVAIKPLPWHASKTTPGVVVDTMAETVVALEVASEATYLVDLAMEQVDESAEQPT